MASIMDPAQIVISSKTMNEAYAISFPFELLSCKRTVHFPLPGLEKVQVSLIIQRLRKFRAFYSIILQKNMTKIGLKIWSDNDLNNSS